MRAASKAPCEVGVMLRGLCLRRVVRDDDGREEALLVLPLLRLLPLRARPKVKVLGVGDSDKSPVAESMSARMSVVQFATSARDKRNARAMTSARRTLCTRSDVGQGRNPKIGYCRGTGQSTRTKSDCDAAAAAGATATAARKRNDFARVMTVLPPLGMVACGGGVWVLVAAMCYLCDMLFE